MEYPTCLSAKIPHDEGLPINPGMIQLGGKRNLLNSFGIFFNVSIQQEPCKVWTERMLLFSMLNFKEVICTYMNLIAISAKKDFDV